MTNTLNNPAVERWLAEEPVAVDVSLGIIQAGTAAPVITCYLVPRCEGVQARFTIRDKGGQYSTVCRKGGYGQATPALEQTWGCSFFRATQFLAHAEEIAWAALADRGVEVPEEFMS